MFVAEEVEDFDFIELHCPLTVRSSGLSRTGHWRHWFSQMVGFFARR